MAVISLVTDAIGRKWQCATIQLDYQLPQRFDLKYIGADNADIVGEGLNILNITDGGLTYLTNSIGGQAGVGLNTVAWR